MDNFTRDEGTSFGIGSSLDTTLMLFQIRKNDSEELQQKSSQKLANSSQNQKFLVNILLRQKLVRRRKFGGRG